MDAQHHNTCKCPDCQETAKRQLPVYAEELRRKVESGEYDYEKLKDLYAKCFSERGLLIMSGESGMADAMKPLQDAIAKELKRVKK
jgi:hypothetical protein